MSRFRILFSSFWFKLSLSAGLLVLLIHQANLTALWRTVIDANAGWLLVALAAYGGSQVLTALRWALLARPLGFNAPVSRFVAYYFSGMYLNLFAPGTIAGDIGRVMFLGPGRRRGLALSSVLAHRTIGLLALVSIGAIAALLQPHYPLPRIVYWAAWLAPFAIIVTWLWGPSFAVRFLPPSHRWRTLVEEDLAPYWKDRSLLAVSFLLACLFHATQIATKIVLALALGLHLPWTYFFIFVPIVNIAATVPIAVSGIGVREAGYWYFLSLIGVDPAVAIALGLLSSALSLVGGLSGAPIFLFAHRRSGRAAGSQEVRAKS